MKNLFADVLQRIRSARPAAKETPQGTTTRLIPVVVASGRSDDYQLIKDALNPARWVTVQARTARDVTSLVQAAVIPVIAYDCELRDADSTTGGNGHPIVRRGTMTVLISDSCSPEALRQVRAEGALDLLIRPLHKDDICAVLETAYQLWTVRQTSIGADSAFTSSTGFRAAS